MLHGLLPSFHFITSRWNFRDEITNIKNFQSVNVPKKIRENLPAGRQVRVTPHERGRFVANKKSNAESDIKIEDFSHAWCPSEDFDRVIHLKAEVFKKRQASPSCDKSV